LITCRALVLASLQIEDFDMRWKKQTNAFIGNLYRCAASGNSTRPKARDDRRRWADIGTRAAHTPTSKLTINYLFTCFGEEGTIKIYIDRFGDEASRPVAHREVRTTNMLAAIYFAR
jgi:hypothetical protein